MELSGIVEQLGSNANKFSIGNAIFSDISDYGFGNFAEFICIHEDTLVLKPTNMDFIAATSIPHAALLALQVLRDMDQIKKGQKLLLNGAGGGVGSFARQLAKMQDCKTSNSPLSYPRCLKPNRRPLSASRCTTVDIIFWRRQL